MTPIPHRKDYVINYNGFLHKSLRFASTYSLRRASSTSDVRKTATIFQSAARRGLRTTTEGGRTQRQNSPKTEPLRLYLANTGLDVCYDGFCAAGNQFPVLITKTRPVRPPVSGSDGRTVVGTSLIDIPRRATTSRRPIMNQCPVYI